MVRVKLCDLVHCNKASEIGVWSTRRLITISLPANKDGPKGTEPSLNMISHNAIDVNAEKRLIKIVRSDNPSNRTLSKQILRMPELPYNVRNMIDEYPKDKPRKISESTCGNSPRMEGRHAVKYAGSGPSTDWRLAWIYSRRALGDTVFLGFSSIFNSEESFSGVTSSIQKRWCRHRPKVAPDARLHCFSVGWSTMQSITDSMTSWGTGVMPANTRIMRHCFRRRENLNSYPWSWE